MFSLLSRGYGTWKGIAKLEKPDSALSDGNFREEFILPPIKKDRQYLYEQPQHDHWHRVPQGDVKLPEVAKNNPLNIPKTYSTKSGALLLYSEGCFVPGSRRLRKRPRFRKRKEKRLHTLRDLTNVILDYKKNEGDPLLLSHLWRKANKSGCDLRPGFSPQRYLTHLGYTTLDPDSWKKLMDTGSLKSLGPLEDDGFLPLLLEDPELGRKLLRQRPQPYTTMSLPPVSPSSSMLGSFTFYQHGMSTGAASMVSMNSLNSDSLDEWLSAKTAGTYVESLTERLAEVESESGFKRNYESLTPKEKEQLLTQLLMDVTMHNQGDIPSTLSENTAESPTLDTIIPRLSNTESSKSLKSLSKSSVASSVCTLPPIVRQGTDSNVSVDLKDTQAEGRQHNVFSSSLSGLGIQERDPGIGLDGIDIEIAEDSVDLGEDASLRLYMQDTDLTLTRSEKDVSKHSLIEALGLQDGESVREASDVVKNVKLLDDSDGFSHSAEEQEGLSRNDSLADTTRSEGLIEDLDRDDTCFSDGNGNGDKAEETMNESDITKSRDVPSPGRKSVEGRMFEHQKSDESLNLDEADSISVKSPGSVPLIALPPSSPKTPHISLSNLQDEVNLVAEQVLSRPQSGRFLSEDAQAATALLMERIEELLGPVKIDDIRVSSAAPMKLRPLGQPRNSEVNRKPKILRGSNRNLRSAGPTLASRSYVSLKSGRAAPPQDGQLDLQNPPEQVPPEEERASGEADTVYLNENDQKEIELNDIILDTNEINKPTTESPKVTSETLPPENEFPTVKDLNSTDQSTEADKITDKTELKDKKEGGKKGRKSKKGVNAKKGNVAKGRRKKKPDARTEARNEQSKTPPFRAGIPPEQKPPKGLDLKPDVKTKRSDNKAAEDKKTFAVGEEKELEVEKPEKPLEHLTDLQTSEKGMRVDSETGEAEQLEQLEQLGTPLELAKTPSSNEVISPLGKTPSSREKTPSSREKTPSSREKTPSSREKTPSSREKTPSSREKTPSPSQEISHPCEKAFSLRKPLSPEAVVAEESETPKRELSPEVKVVISERARRANARAAQRAAAAERRRQEVERKRREREEARRKAQEEEARLEQLRREADEEMKKREEERRLQREQEELERRRREAEENERLRQEQIILERQKAVREEWQRKKKQLLAERKLEEEMRKERERVEQQIEEEKKREYEERIAHLEDEERERLMEERRIEEERIKREIEEERQKREEERRRAMEERRKVEEELAALRERQLARQLFLESLLKEYQELLFEQRITRAFTFSYFDILPWFKETWDTLEEDRPMSHSLETDREDEEVKQTL